MILNLLERHIHARAPFFDSYGPFFDSYVYVSLILMCTLIYILLFEKERSRLVKYTEAELVMNPRHLTPMSNILVFVILVFLTHFFWHRFSCIYNLR